MIISSRSHQQLVRAPLLGRLFRLCGFAVAHMALQPIIFSFPEVVGSLRKVSDNLTLIELIFVNNRVLKAWLHSLPCRINMASSVYCSGKVLRTFARNFQSKNVNTCKLLYFSKLLSNYYFFVSVSSRKT